MKIKISLCSFLVISLLITGCSDADTYKRLNSNSDKINRLELPVIPPKIGTYNELDARDTKAPEPFDVKAPEGSPNVVVIMLDDVGFGQPSTFGGPIATPTADKLSASGIKYNQFTVNPICSPSRAALLTGRNAHKGHLGVVAEVATSYPGYDGKRPNSIAPLAQILQLNGYSTAYIGKNHETPNWTVSSVGPFHYWPTRSGFDKFYGFIGDEQNMWYPSIYDGTSQVEVDYSDENFHLQEDFAREAVEWVQQQNSLNPDKPFFMYFSTGTAHAPHQVPQEYIDKYKGKFKDGWDVLRQKTFERQKALGIIPEDTELPQKEEYIVDWNTLSEDEKKVHEREMEVGAAFIEHADVQVGKVIKSIEEMGKLDNTVVIYIMGDNGASAEGTISGLTNINKYYNNILDDAKKHVNKIDEFGGKEYYGIYSSGWAVAGCSPFKWTKQMASGGGTRSAMIVSYPDKIKSKNEIRTQLHHLIDIAPTVLELTHIPEPKVVNGAKQIPMQGVSMTYTFEDKEAKSKRKTQYYEAFGNRAIYHNGWWAQVIHKAPWEQKPRCLFKDDVWELYDLTSDFSMANDLAGQHPEKLEELKKQFDIQAKENNVYPLDDRVVERINPKIAGRPDLMFGRSELRLYEGMVDMRENAFLNTKNTSFSVEANVLSKSNGEGVLLSMGGKFGGYSLFMKQGYLHFVYNYLGDIEYDIVSKTKLKAGDHKIVFRFDYDGDGVGKGGLGSIMVDGKKVADGRIEKTMPFVYSTSEGASVGQDFASNVSKQYKVGPSNHFNGRINEIKVNLLE